MVVIYLETAAVGLVDLFHRVCNAMSSP